MTPPPDGLWSERIVAEQHATATYRMYVDRPRRIDSLLPFASRWGDRAFIVQGDSVLTFAALLQASAAKARLLAEAGVLPGQLVLLLGWNGADWAVNYWACLRCGAVPVLGNAWWGGAEVADALALVEPVLTLVDARLDGRVPAQWRRGPWDAPAARPGGRADGPVLPGDEDIPAVIIFTSGTEGRAKAVVLSHRALIASMMMLLHVARRLPYVPDDGAGEVSLHTGPLFHIGGSHALIRAVVNGNTLVFPRGRFDPAEAMQLIERHRISRWSAVVPTMVSRLLDHPDVRVRDLSSLKAIGMGGAPVHAGLLERLRVGLPGVEARIAVGYGLSENAGQATAASGRSSARHPGTSGRPLPLVELRTEAREGFADGEVLVRSPTQMSGYYGTAASPIDAEGWLRTGDLGRIDADGLLWITGRSKEIIIRGGENIAPAAVEQALAALPAVAEAAVVGVPHPDLGEEVMAFVVLKEAATADSLRRQLRGSVAAFAIPSRWRLGTAELPTNGTGKVDKGALLAWARANGDAT